MGPHLIMAGIIASYNIVNSTNIGSGFIGLTIIIDIFSYSRKLVDISS